ncbi:KTSC domain-containing protein [Streptomyces sp. NPDC096323]|uniref:KTSC domain-containing protein n=1 Tax=Streptomyces sp. NPDC096323 TaxID=3155822 RepID=UPI00331B0A42
MLHEPVRSSNVRSVGYSRAERVLEVSFHSGGLYRTLSVPFDLGLTSGPHQRPRTPTPPPGVKSRRVLTGRQVLGCSSGSRLSAKPRYPVSATAAHTSR